MSSEAEKKEDPADAANEEDVRIELAEERKEERNAEWKKEKNTLVADSNPRETARIVRQFSISEQRDRASTLFTAALNNETVLVRQLLAAYLAEDNSPLEGSRSLDVNTIDPIHKKTPLHVAAENKNYFIAQLLVKAEAKLDLKDKNGYVPLHFAAQSGSVEIIELLLDNGADVNVLSDSATPVTPLHLATQHGHALAIEKLLEKGADPDYVDSRGRGAVYKACRWGYSDALETLVVYGAKVTSEMMPELEEAIELSQCDTLTKNQMKDMLRFGVTKKLNRTSASIEDKAVFHRMKYKSLLIEEKGGIQVRRLVSKTDFKPSKSELEEIQKHRKEKELTRESTGTYSPSRPLNTSLKNNCCSIL